MKTFENGSKKQILQTFLFVTCLERWENELINSNIQFFHNLATTQQCMTPQVSRNQNNNGCQFG